MENNQNQNNPTGIWQHIWVTLIIQALEEYKRNDYVGCYNTTKLLKTQLPPECETEITEKFNVIIKILKKISETKGSTLQQVQDKQIYLIHNELPEPLLELLGAVRKSLFDKGWINKNFGASPINKKKPHIGEN